jgi:hypothetical protein
MEKARMRSFYRAVAYGTVWTLGFEFVLSVLMAFGGFDPLSAFDRLPLLVWPPVAALILFLVVGGFVLWIGMIWDCAVAVEVSVWSKVLWLLLVVLTPNLGALVYYFCVFKRRAQGSEANAQERRLQV